MQYSQETQEEVLVLLAEGFSAKEIHEVTGVSPSTIYRWRDDNSRGNSQDSRENSQDSRENNLNVKNIAEFLRKYLGPQLESEISIADNKLAEAMGTFSEKMWRNKLDKLMALKRELEQL